MALTGDVGEHRDRLIAFLDSQNIALEYTENIAPALGVSYGGKIAILPGQSPAEELVTLVHELGHEYLHKSERRTMTTATVRETEAEAVAFIVGQAIGLEMGRASSDYIQMYAGISPIFFIDFAPVFIYGTIVETGGYLKESGYLMEPN